MVLHLKVSASTGATSREMFDYSTAAADMAMFTIGSLYFAAGSYNQGNSRIKDTYIFDKATKVDDGNNADDNNDNNIRSPLAQKLYNSTGTIEPLV